MTHSKHSASPIAPAGTIFAKHISDIYKKYKIIVDWQGGSFYKQKHSSILKQIVKGYQNIKKHLKRETTCKYIWTGAS